MVAIFILFLILFVWFVYFNSQHHVRIIDRIPGPPSLLRPLIGNLHQFYTTNDKLWEKLRKMADVYYPIFRLWRFGRPMIMIRHPDDAEILLTSTKNITKGPIYEHLHPWLGTGLLTSTGSKWKNRRKILTPSFHFNILNEFMEVFEIQAKQLVNFIKSSDAGVLDVTPIYTKFTLNAICETAMGTQLTDDDEAEEEFRLALHDMGHLIFHLTLNPWAKIPWLFNILPIGRLQSRIVSILHKFSTKIIRERKQYHEENNVKETINVKDEDENRNCSESQPKKRVALLDLLIQCWKRGEIDEVGVREEVDTFIFGGHDTTSTAMIFITLVLAEHQDIQDRARKEADQIFEKSTGNLEISDLQNLTYLEMCIKESLRLYPVVTAIQRIIEDDLQFRDYLIPKGSEVCLSFYDLHRDPNFWPNPNEFNPDRFDPENIGKRHPYSYLPFSAGRRNCIGQKFAMLEMKLFVAYILHHFYLEPIDRTEDMTIQLDLVLRASHPLRVKFIPRN